MLKQLFSMKINFKLLSAALAFSTLVPFSAQASSTTSAKNLDIYFDQGQKAFDKENWTVCEDNFRQWLLLGKSQPEESISAASHNYALCTLFAGSKYFTKGLELWNAMPKRVVNGQVRFKEHHWEKVSPYFETSLNKAYSSIQLKPEEPFAWYQKGVSEYHLFRFADACKSLKTAKALYQKEGDGLDQQTKVVLRESCNSAGRTQGPRAVGQLKSRTIYGTTSKAYNEQLKDQAKYAERCHEYGALKYHHYDKCTGTFERSRSYYHSN